MPPVYGPSRFPEYAFDYSSTRFTGGIKIIEGGAKPTKQDVAPVAGKGKQKVSHSNYTKSMLKKWKQQNAGEGLFINPVTGSVHFNPGMSTLKVISSGNPVPIDEQRVITTDPPMHIYDPRPKYGEFQAPGLQWQGKDAVTARQLTEESQKRVGQVKKRARDNKTSDLEKACNMRESKRRKTTNNEVSTEKHDEMVKEKSVAVRGLNPNSAQQAVAPQARLQAKKMAKPQQPHTNEVIPKVKGAVDLSSTKRNKLTSQLTEPVFTEVEGVSNNFALGTGAFYVSRKGRVSKPTAKTTEPLMEKPAKGKSLQMHHQNAQGNMQKHLQKLPANRPPWIP